MWSGERVHGGHVHSAFFLVQSDDHSPCCLDESIEYFLAGFREVSGRSGRGFSPFEVRHPGLGLLVMGSLKQRVAAR